MTETDSARPVVVAGGGYAGVLAANRLVGRVGSAARIVLVTPGDSLTDRVRLHEAAARARPVQHALDKLLHPRIERIDARLVSIDPAGRSIALERTPGAREQLGYAALILALGSRFAAPIPAHSPHAFALRDAASALAMARALRRLPDAAQVAVVGGGLTAVELAAEIAEARRTLRVALVTSELLPQLEGPARDAVRQALGALGVEIREGCRVAALEHDALRFADGSRWPVALSVLASGFVPAAQANELGLPASSDGRVAVDEYLRVRGLDNVFAVGDLAAPPAESVGSGLATTRMGCVSAMPMGAHAADQVLRLRNGQALLPFGFRYFVQCISLGRRRGVIVSVDADDRPTGRRLRGARAALVKELVCRFVLSAIRLERLFPGLYAWPGRRSLPRLPRISANQLPG
jgi:NADH dehydrogenase FAD-containing subunit